MTISFFRQVFAGKTIGRILFNQMVGQQCASLSGRVVDLAGGAYPSYRNLLPKEVSLVVTDYKKAQGVDLVVDLNAPLPFTDSSEGTFLCFNAIYILEDRIALLQEIHRSLRLGGRLFLSSPFVTNEMREPHDFVRLTREGLLNEFSAAGFLDVTVIPYGERCTSAAYLLHPVLRFNTLRYLVDILALLLDRLIPASVTENHPAPIGYFVIAKKT